MRATMAAIVLTLVFTCAGLAAANQIVLLDAPPPPPPPSPQSAGNSSARLLQATSQHQQPPTQIQASFSTPNQAINITHVTYDPLHDTVYLGATNAIYQLNGSDLS